MRKTSMLLATFVRVATAMSDGARAIAGLLFLSHTSSNAMTYALLSNESMGRADSQGHRRRARPGSLLATTMKSVSGR